jgi:hypothetical protein
MKIRDRIKEFKRVHASELIPNPKNWRTHPSEQADALKGILAEVGYVDAVMAVERDGMLMLVDGHLRAETSGDAEIPVLIVELSDEEIDKVLLTFDPLGAMATQNDSALRDLLNVVETENDALDRLIMSLDSSILDVENGWDVDDEDVDKHGENTDGITKVLKLLVAPSDIERAKNLIELSLDASGIKYEFE